MQPNVAITNTTARFAEQYWHCILTSHYCWCAQQGDTCLITAIAEGFSGIAKLLIEKKRSLVTYRNPQVSAHVWSSTLLLQSCYASDPRCACLLSNLMSAHKYCWSCFHGLNCIFWTWSYPVQFFDRCSELFVTNNLLEITETIGSF